MLINVNIEQTQPLVGSASTGQERSVSFVGWLELLRVIADLAETTEHPDDEASNANAPLPTRGTTAARPA